MPGRRFTDAEEEQIAIIYQSEISTRSIARAYGLNHHGVICAALKRQRVEQRSPAERNRLYALNPYAFDEINNEHTAYWWGFLYADGCVHRRSLILALKWSDRNHVEKFKGFMQSKSPIRQRRSGNTNNARVEFTDGYLAQRMIELGIVAGRTNKKAVQEWLPNHLAWHWIRGYFDGDGTARKNPSGGVGFCGTKATLEWIKKIAARDAGTGLKMSIRKHKTANVYYLRFGGRLQGLKIADCMYQDATIYLPRKKAIFDSWPQQRDRILPPQCYPSYVIKRKREG